jgi:hypothetical protein
VFCINVRIILKQILNKLHELDSTCSRQGQVESAVEHGMNVWVEYEVGNFVTAE